MFHHQSRVASSFAALALVCAVACDTNSSSPASPPDDPPPADTTNTTNHPTLTYQFGAKFEPPVGRVVHGMGQWVEYNPPYLALLPASEKPGGELEQQYARITSRASVNGIT